MKNTCFKAHSLSAVSRPLAIGRPRQVLADAKGLATTWVVRQLAGGQGECTLTTGDGWYFIQPHPLANNRLLVIFTMHDNDLFVDVAVYLFLYKRNRTIQEELLPASPIMIKERIIYIISSNFYNTLFS